MGLDLKPGDTFLFSSKTIPGNEVAVARILNQLSEKGVQVIDDSDGHYHVSGHANRPGPRDAAGAAAAADDRADARRAPPPRDARGAGGERGIAAAVAPNGTMLDLTGDAPRIVEQSRPGGSISTGRC